MDFTVNGTNAFLIVIITFLISLILVELCKKVALHIGAIDVPDKRKVHKNPIPRLGGLGIFSAFLIGYMLFGSPSEQMVSILIGAFIIIVTGICDDINSIPAKIKFLFQLIAAIVVVFYGNLYFSSIQILGYELIFSQILGKVISTVMIVAIINAINLVDGLDGLSSGVSSIYFLTISIIAFILNRLAGLDVILSLIMLGAVLGFWVHNFPNAKIFAGDTGSMFMGYMISIIALLGYKLATITSIIIPICVILVPISDTLLAIVRRTLKHEAIDAPDKDHLHHQLMRMTSSKTKAVLIIYLMTAMFSLASILYVLRDTIETMAIYGILLLVFLFLILKTDILFKHKEKSNEKD